MAFVNRLGDVCLINQDTADEMLYYCEVVFCGFGELDGKLVVGYDLLHEEIPFEIRYGVVVSDVDVVD